MNPIFNNYFSRHSLGFPCWGNRDPKCGNWKLCSFVISTTVWGPLVEYRARLCSARGQANRFGGGQMRFANVPCELLHLSGFLLEPARLTIPYTLPNRVFSQPKLSRIPFHRNPQAWISIAVPFGIKGRCDRAASSFSKGTIDARKKITRKKCHGSPAC